MPEMALCDNIALQVFNVTQPNANSQVSQRVLVVTGITDSSSVSSLDHNIILFQLVQFCSTYFDLNSCCGTLLHLYDYLSYLIVFMKME